jgi:hypothetical protein
VKEAVGALMTFGKFAGKAASGQLARQETAELKRIAKKAKKK